MMRSQIKITGKNNIIESDFDLFKYAKNKVLKLEKEKQPYNL